jgi:3-deoxy-D-arabino-heptulosonate 7-phosphate (DAHP) synthase class II
VDTVRSQLAEVAAGSRFLLQGGDCAERFADCTAAAVEAKLRILQQMSLVLTWGARVPTLRIGRLAGQFSKPRSSDTEDVDGGMCGCEGVWGVVIEWGWGVRSSAADVRDVAISFPVL